MVVRRSFPSPIAGEGQGGGKSEHRRMGVRPLEAASTGSRSAVA
jgi:hypothetical protein